jgi:hypothetical protein
MADMETWYVERMTRDNCNIEASIQYVNGKPENLIMRGDGCTAKLSTTRGNTIEFADQYEVSHLSRSFFPFFFFVCGGGGEYEWPTSDRYITRGLGSAPHFFFFGRGRGLWTFVCQYVTACL